MKKPVEKIELGKVYCPMCTHTVDAVIQRVRGMMARRLIVRPGQKCPHCSASLDSGYIFQTGRAA